MGVGPEVEPGGVDARVVEQGHLDGRGHRPRRREGQQHPDPPGEGAGQGHHPQHHQGPDQVELLLDGQGPGVGEGVDRSGDHEVAAAGGDLPPVGEVEERRQGAHPEVGVEAGRLDEPDQQGHRHQHDQEGRQQAAGPTQPEGRQLDGAPTAVLAEQQPGDQVAGQHVEDVEAEEAALQPPHPEVVAHDDQEGHGPDPVEGGDALPAGGRRAGVDRPGVVGRDGARCGTVHWGAVRGGTARGGAVRWGAVRWGLTGVVSSSVMGRSPTAGRSGRAGPPAGGCRVGATRRPTGRCARRRSTGR